MAIITSVRYSQPLGPVRVASAWRSRVMSAWYPNASVDLVRGHQLTLNGTGYSVNAGKLICPGATVSTNYADLGVLTGPSDLTQISSLTIATPTTLSARNTLFDTANFGGSAGHGYLLAEGYGADTTKGFLYNDANFVAENWSGLFAANQSRVFGTSYNKTTNAVSIYRDGGLFGTGTFNAAADVQYGSGSRVYCVGGRKDSTTNTFGWNGTIELQVLFFNVLSAAEFAQLGANPWSLFEPIRRAVFFAPAAAGANQSVNVPVVDVAWAALAPTVNRTQSISVPAVDVAWDALAPTVTRGISRTVTVPVVDVAWDAFAPTVNRTQSIAVPAADVAWNALAPTVSQSTVGTITIPVVDVAWNALATTINQSRSVTVPAADVAWAALAPTLGQGQSVTVPAADVAWAGVAPVINRSQSILVPEFPIVWDGLPPTIINSGTILPPAALAEMYGGGWRKRKKKEEEPTIEEMVEAIADEPKGKEKIVALLPKKVRQELPDDMWEVSVDKLVREVKEASDRVQAGVERLYEKRRQKDDDEAFMLLNL